MSHDRYGHIKNPDTQADIQVIENPANTARTAYTLWRTTARPERYVFGQGWPQDKHLAEQIYQDAARILAPSAEAFRDVKPKQLEAILSEVKPSHGHASGLFISALLNETDLAGLDGVFQYDILGYRLAPGKRLVVRDGSKVYNLGQHARGELINHGQAMLMAFDASEGIQANFGTVAHNFACDVTGGLQVNFCHAENTANGAAGGVQLNFGTCNGFGHILYGGVQANYGIAKHMASVFGPRGGVQANLGTVKQELANSARAGLQVNYGEVDYAMAQYVRGANARNGTQLNRGSAHEDHCRRYRWKSRAAKDALVSELERRLRALEPLGKLSHQPGKAMAALRKYDWPAFVQDILQLGTDIAALRR